MVFYDLVGHSEGYFFNTGVKYSSKVQYMMFLPVANHPEKQAVIFE